MQNFTILHPVVKKFFAKEQTDRQTDRHTGNFIYIDSNFRGTSKRRVGGYICENFWTRTSVAARHEEILSVLYRSPFLAPQYVLAIIMATISSVIIVLMAGAFIVSCSKKKEKPNDDRMALGQGSANCGPRKKFLWPLNNLTFSA